MKIEVLYFAGCPNHQPAVDAMQSVAAELGLAVTVESLAVQDEADAARWAFMGSPTIRVDGVDVDAEGAHGSPRMGCRLYKTPAGLAGVPAHHTLRTALIAALRALPTEAEP